MTEKSINTNKIRNFFIMLFTFLCVVMPAQALFVSPPKDPIPLIHEIFPEATLISEKQGEPLIWTIYKEEEILGYAFETNDLAKIPAYSGEPVNMLVAINPEGVYLGAKVLEHHEPIILAGIVALANVIPDMGALSSANLMGNYIPVEQAQELKKIMQAKENLTTLCGLSKEETELDFSRQYLGAGDAVLIANDISDMGALTSLNLSSNNLRAKGAKIMAEAIKVTNCVTAAILAPFSCLSDHWLNCCCLLLSTGYGGVDEPGYLQPS